MTKNIITIDGLDGAGKSTLTNDLITFLIERFKEDDNTVILFQHFPDYRSLSGHKIKKMLKSLPDDMDKEYLDNLVSLFMKDRSIWWKINTTDMKVFNDKTHFFIIFDRYKLSNLFLNAYRYEKYGLNIDQACDHIIDMEKDFDYPESDLNVVLTANPDVIKERMEKKRNITETDKNETEEAVDNAIKNFNSVVNWMDHRGKDKVPPYILINEADIREGRMDMEKLWSKIEKKLKKGDKRNG